MASALFFFGFNIVVGTLFYFNLNAGNLVISVVTADAVLLGAAGARAGWVAIHTKLDALIASNENVSNMLLRAEELEEDKIKELRP